MEVGTPGMYSGVEIKPEAAFDIAQIIMYAKVRLNCQ